MTTTEEQSQSVNPQQYQFIERVTGLPVIHVALEKAKYVYDGTKTRIPLIGQVETGISQSIAPQLWTTVAPLSKPLTTIDSYACMGLDVLEKSLPVIKETPEDILASGKSMIDSKIITPVTGVVNNIDGLIDHAISVSEAKTSQEQSTDPQPASKIKRVQKITNNLKNSAYVKIKSNDLSKISSEIIKRAATIVNSNAIKLNETIHALVEKINIGDGQILKNFEVYFKELKSNTELLVESTMSFSTARVRETSLAVILSLTQFTNKAAQSVTELTEKIKSTQVEDISYSQLLQKIEQSLSSLRQVSMTLVQMTSKYQVLSNFAVPSKVVKEETDKSEEHKETEMTSEAVNN